MAHYCPRAPMELIISAFTLVDEQGVARLGPPCSVGRPTTHAPAADRPLVRWLARLPAGSITDNNKRRQMTTDTSDCYYSAPPPTLCVDGPVMTESILKWEKPVLLIRNDPVTEQGKKKT